MMVKEGILSFASISVCSKGQGSSLVWDSHGAVLCLGRTQQPFPGIATEDSLWWSNL